MRVRRVVVVLLLVSVVCVAPVHAQENTTDTGSDEDDDGGDTIVNIDLGKVVDAIDDLINDFDSFTDTWDETLEELLKAVLFGPFLALLKYLVTELAAVLLHTPDVYPNPAVEQIHRQTLIITYLLTGLAVMAAGILHMVGPVAGVNYSQVRLILPKLVVGLVFATVSLPLLQYIIEFCNALVYAFKPTGLETSIGEMYGTATTLVLVWVVNSWLLLAVIVLFVVRSVYLLFVAAISPLIALAWSLPKVKRYADSFIAGWFTALAMAPLDMLVLKFGFALLQGQGAGFTGTVSDWVYGIASAVLLLWIPYQLYGASQTALGQAYGVAGSVKKRVRQQRNTRSQPDLTDDEQRRLEAYRERKQNQSNSQRNKFN